MLAALLCLCGCARAGSPLADWAVLVIAGDDATAHERTPTEAFDNARRGVAQGLIARGADPAHLVQVSLHPDRWPADHAFRADFATAMGRLAALARDTRGGCLVYLTSHGDEDGALVGEEIVSPQAFAGALARACPGKPAAVVISACYSGVFVPALSGPDRFVLTAARRDRSSFGCGEADRTPYFDGCIIEALPDAADLAALARTARACVARRERETGMAPPSQPQLAIGARFEAPTLRAPHG